MKENNLTDEQDNLLIEFDGYGFVPTITMPNAEEYAIEWKKRLIRVFGSQNDKIERLMEEKNESAKTAIEILEQNIELQKQVDELNAVRENVQKILYELGKCGNDEERYVVWVKLIKYCGVEVE